VASLRRRAIDRPAETVEIPGGTLMSYDFGDLGPSRSIFNPGWRWSTSVKPVAGTEWCEFRHVGYTLSGRAHVVTRDGAEMEFGPGEIYEIPPGHDAWVVGDEPWDSIDWAPASAYARAAAGSGRRIVATLLFTDIVGSTEAAGALGDTHWIDALARHNTAVRGAIDRLGGSEVATTGDGFLFRFDGAERAVRAGQAAATAAESTGVRLRAGIHTGEIEISGSDATGLAIHIASRVLALAGPSEILVSWTTRDLLDGSTVRLDDLGPQELKGVPGARHVFRVAATSTE
jgi:class 3 adenylate cyclase